MAADPDDLLDRIPVPGELGRRGAALLAAGAEWLGRSAEVGARHLVRAARIASGGPMAPPDGMIGALLGEYRDYLNEMAQTPAIVAQRLREETEPAGERLLTWLTRAEFHAVLAGDGGARAASRPEEAHPSAGAAPPPWGCDPDGELAALLRDGTVELTWSRALLRELQQLLARPAAEGDLGRTRLRAAAGDVPPDALLALAADIDALGVALGGDADGGGAVGDGCPDPLRSLGMLADAQWVVTPEDAHRFLGRHPPANEAAVADPVSACVGLRGTNDVVHALTATRELLLAIRAGLDASRRTVRLGPDAFERLRRAAVHHVAAACTQALSLPLRELATRAAALGGTVWLPAAGLVPILDRLDGVARRVAAAEGGAAMRVFAALDDLRDGMGRERGRPTAAAPAEPATAALRDAFARRGIQLSPQARVSFRGDGYVVHDGAAAARFHIGCTPRRLASGGWGAGPADESPTRELYPLRGVPVPRRYALPEIAAPLALPFHITKARQGLAVYGVDRAAVQDGFLGHTTFRAVDAGGGRTPLAVFVVDCLQTDIGPYHELGVACFVTADGDALNTGMYMLHYVVDAHAAMVSGNAIWGYAKRMGVIGVDYAGGADSRWRIDLGKGGALTLELPRFGTGSSRDIPMPLYTTIDGMPMRSVLTRSGDGEGLRSGGAGVELGLHPGQDWDPLLDLFEQVGVTAQSRPDLAGWSEHVSTRLAIPYPVGE